MTHYCLLKLTNTEMLVAEVIIHMHYFPITAKATWENLIEFERFKLALVCQTLM